MSESQSITITYDGYVIKTIEAGQIARMPCAGKGMESDVVVSFGTDGYIYYDGVQKQYQAGQVAIMACEGKKMKTDIIVETEQLAGVWLLNVDLLEQSYSYYKVTGTTYCVDHSSATFTSISISATLSIEDKNGDTINSYYFDGDVYMKTYRGNSSPIGSVYRTVAGKEENKHVRTLIIDTRFTIDNSIALRSLLSWLKRNAVKIG